MRYHQTKTGLSVVSNVRPETSYLSIVIRHRVFAVHQRTSAEVYDIFRIFTSINWSVFALSGLVMAVFSVMMVVSVMVLSAIGHSCVCVAPIFCDDGCVCVGPV